MLRILLTGLLIGLILVIAGCSTAGVNPVAGTASVAGAATPQQKAAQASVNLQAVLNDIVALEPVAGAAATGIEAAVAPELIPLTTAISAAVNVANQSAVVAVKSQGVPVASPVPGTPSAVVLPPVREPVASQVLQILDAPK